ncbi:MAG: ABC transporter permease, partial [Planctomycetes bacterium]|nr:ABC transporter permease [Planctomycetota bacterium]
MIPQAFLWNNLRLRPIRTLLTILSVAGSVAAVVSVLQATAATQIQLQAIHTTFDSPVSMEVVAADTSAFSLDDVPALAQLPSIEAIIPVFRVFTKVVAGDKDVRCLTMGTDLQQYQTIRDFTLVSGQMPTDTGEVCVEESIANHLGVQSGAEIRIASKRRPWLVAMHVTGIFRLSATDSMEERASVITTLT